MKESITLKKMSLNLLNFKRRRKEKNSLEIY